MQPAPGGRLSVERATLLGAIQGPTELLPVSSSAHLALLDEKTGPLPVSWPGGTGTEPAVAAVRVTAAGGAKVPAGASPEAVFGRGLALLPHTVGAGRPPPGRTLQ